MSALLDPKRGRGRCAFTPDPCTTLAQAHDLDIAPHGSQDIHIHLVAAISNGLILEFCRDTVDPMWSRIYRETLKLNDDGTVSAPLAPGIGIDPNEDVLAPYRIA